MTWISFKQCCTSGSYLRVDQRRFHSPINTCQVQFLLSAHSNGISFHYETKKRNKMEYNGSITRTHTIKTRQINLISKLIHHQIYWARWKVLLVPLSAFKNFLLNVKMLWQKVTLFWHCKLFMVTPSVGQVHAPVLVAHLGGCLCWSVKVDFVSGPHQEFNKKAVLAGNWDNWSGQKMSWAYLKANYKPPRQVTCNT